MRVASLEDLESLIEHGSIRPEPPRPIPEAQIMTLRELLLDYGKPWRFKVGDLVTPKKGFGAVKGAGEPHIVLEINGTAPLNFDASVGSQMWGSRLDIRVATLQSGEYVAHWMESWILEAYPENTQVVSAGVDFTENA